MSSWKSRTKIAGSGSVNQVNGSKDRGIYTKVSRIRNNAVRSSVVDPHWLQCGFGSRFRWPEILKFYSWKKSNIFSSKIVIYIYPQASMKDVQATGEAFSSQREHPALGNMILFYFCGLILPSWIRIRPTKINADSCGSWSTSPGRFLTNPNINFLFSAHEKNGIQTWDSTQADGQCILKYYVCWLPEKE